MIPQEVYTIFKFLLHFGSAYLYVMSGYLLAKTQQFDLFLVLVSITLTIIACWL